jgi:hypothetical protein
MGRRRILPSRDPPVRAGTVAQCRPEPRRRSLADVANALGAVAASGGRLATAGVGATALSAAFAASSSNRCPGSALLNASLDAAARRVEGDLRDRYYPPPR